MLPDGRLECAGIVLESGMFRVEWLPAHDGDGVGAAMDGQAVVKLSLVMTQELELEGLAREMNRLLQDARKRSGFGHQDRIVLSLFVDGRWADAVESHRDWLAEQLLADIVYDGAVGTGVDVKDESGVFKADMERISS